MKIVRVNMTTATITEEEFIQKDWGYYGGRGLVDTVLTNECNATCDPLGPENMLIFATGYFAGTNMTTSGRISIGGKSPLTGGIKESNAGGMLATAMAAQGIKMIIVTGQPKDGDHYYLYVDKAGKISLNNADKYWGLMNYPLGAMLRENLGKDIAIASIGPAGERKALASSILVTEYKSDFACRAAARGAMGAVMGSKGLKAVVVDYKPAKKYSVAIPEEYKDEWKECVKAVAKSVTDNPMTGGTQRKYGSAAGVGATGKMGALPWKNFSGKICPDYEKLGPEAWFKALTEQGGHGTIPCHPGCVCCCSNEFHGPDGKYLSAGIEYETLVFMGTQLDIFNPNFVAAGDRFCDDYGIDTIDVGNGIAVAMDEGIIPWGDEEAAMKLLKSVADPDDELGKVLVNGCQAMGEHLNAKRIPTVKRQSLAAYDPRVLVGFGMTFERSPMGADHTSAMALTMRKDLCPEDQVDLNQAWSAACDNCVCLFAWGSINFNQEGRAALARAFTILAGEPEAPKYDIFEKIGRECLYMEHKFNEKNGFTLEDDKFMTDFFYKEPAEVNGAVYTSPLTRSFIEIADERAAQKAQEEK